ncbi:MAG: hypothetical protein ACTSXQ_02790 [Alphaproteobacteria bacterium]
MLGSAACYFNASHQMAKADVRALYKDVIETENIIKKKNPDALLESKYNKKIIELNDVLHNEFEGSEKYISMKQSLISEYTK